MFCSNFAAAGTVPCVSSGFWLHLSLSELYAAFISLYNLEIMNTIRLDGFAEFVLSAGVTLCSR
jgi:hypothetical protein